MKKKTYKSLIFVLASIAAFSVIFIYIADNEESYKDDQIVIYFPPGGDFSNPDQGRIILEFSFPTDSFMVGSQVADTFMFLDSKTVPGLKITYSQKDKRIYAGMPVLKTKQVELMDGEGHKLEYSFNRGGRQQAVLLDDEILASGEFTGNADLTGYFAYEDLDVIESTFPVDVRID
jgi:hypothetical protein